MNRDADSIQGWTMFFRQFKSGMFDIILQNNKLKDTFFQLRIDNPWLKIDEIL
jgi:hypothetical protein